MGYLNIKKKNWVLSNTINVYKSEFTPQIARSTEFVLGLGVKVLSTLRDR